MKIASRGDFSLARVPREEISLARGVKQCPWYADTVNYLVCGIDPPDMTYQQKKKFKSDAKHFY